MNINVFVFFNISFRKVSNIVSNSNVISAAAAAVASASVQQQSSSSVGSPSSVTASSNVNEASEGPEWTYDPTEPRYCICNQVSYGDMVACDNTDVSFNNLNCFNYYCCKKKKKLIITLILYSVHSSGSIIPV